MFDNDLDLNSQSKSYFVKNSGGEMSNRLFKQNTFQLHKNYDPVEDLTSQPRRIGKEIAFIYPLENKGKSAQVLRK